MALYFVDYDLRKQRNYQALYECLYGLGAVRVLESQWVLEHSNSSALIIRNHLWQFMDQDDGLVVSEVRDWASFNTLAPIPNT